MAMTINTNVVSINAQRNLGLSGSSLGTTMQRLSSGLRVNSAKDDAAGLAIAERMNAQAKGLAVAARNANDGISLAQTAEGALGKVGDMLQRMRELAVQSSNATNSAADREALQAEVSQLRSEIDRVAKTTTFNNQKILDGSFSGGVFQIGASAGDNITVGGITNAKMDALGSATYGASSFSGKLEDIKNFADPIETGLTIKVGDAEPLDLGKLAGASSASERLGQVVSAINAKTADTGVTAFLSQDGKGGYSVEVRSSGEQKVEFGAGFTAAAAGVAGGAAPTAFTKTAGALGGLNTHSAPYDGTEFGKALAEVETDPILSKVASQWASAKADHEGDATGGKSADLKDAIYAVVDKVNTAIAGKVTFDALTAPTATEIKTYGQELEAALGIDIADTEFDAIADADGLAKIKELEQQLGFSGLNIEEGAKQVGIAELDISTQAGAWEALSQIDTAIDQINSARADLGALQTRFEKAIENIDIMNENITASRGRIVDADFATETANLSRAQILQQAGTAMVAQANQLPQQVLSLLQ